ncbi:DNA gyrase inhibitor YacG [Sneathiella sp.]|uniref:DNA gyrase inhibitor YacG n=1 Tax=Sneathiella sp. TaxID=1964365 RepID=UPI00261989A5|nr:DNA gyrase inhibitor YacG [Sneathiella sp.]MDF2367936.1 DNA gyrase inhibitor YacG [Sneathiella sp.]
MKDANEPVKPCPQCGKPGVHKFRPFCSARCKQVDLGKWFNEAYVIPGEETIPANDEDGE